MSKENKEELVEAASQTGLVNTSPVGHIQVEPEDIDIPRLNIMQKTSAMNFDIGALVIDKSHEIVGHSTPTQCIVLSAKKMWREDVPFDEDKLPEMAFDRDGMEKLKRESDYPVIEFAEIAMLFPENENSPDSDAYAFPIGDVNYALGKINVAKDAYRKTYKSLATFAVFNRTLPVYSRMWNFESQLMERGKYKWHVPSLTATKEPTPQEVVDFAVNFGA